MFAARKLQFSLFTLTLVTFLFSTTKLVAEPSDDDAPYGDSESNGPQIEDDGGTPPPPPPPQRTRRRQTTPRRQTHQEKQRKYFVPDTDRTDAGIFHVGFAVGGNFYMEPELNATTRVATGDYFRDLGFQLGVFFDYDYSALTENVPLGLRGMVGYKYVLNSENVFAFDGMARYMMRFSDRATFGIGLGASAAIWYRVASTTSQQEIIFLPSFLLGAGFEYNPFMVDFKWLINRIGEDSTIMGFELYFGLRL